MASEADIQEPILAAKREGEDNKLTSESLDMSATTFFPEEMKKIETITQAHGTIYYPEEPEKMSLATNIADENVNAVVQGNFGTKEGEIFLESPSAAKVAGNETSRVNANYQAAEVPTHEEMELTKNGTFKEEVEDHHVEIVAIASHEGNKQQSAEDLRFSEEDEKNIIMRHEKAESVTDKQTVQVQEATYGQNEESEVQTPDLTGDLNINIEKSRETWQNKECIDNVLMTKAVSTEENSKEASFLGVEQEQLKSSNSEGKEMDSEAMRPSQTIECKKHDGEEMPENGTKEGFTSMESSLNNQKQKEATCEALENNPDKSLVTALIDESSSVNAGLDEVGKLEGQLSITLENRNQETVESSEMTENLSSTTKEIQQMSNTEAEEDIKGETSKLKEHLEQSFLSKEEPAKEKHDSSFGVAPEETQTDTSNENVATVSQTGEQMSTENIEEIEETIKDQTIFSTITLNEKNGGAEVEIQNKNGEDVSLINPLVVETIEVGDEKQDKTSTSDLKEDHEANGIPMYDEMHVSEAHEASKSSESILEQPSAEGAPTELISETSEIYKTEKVCEMNSEEKLQDKDAVHMQREEIKQKEEESILGSHKITTEGDDNERSTGNEDAPLNTPGVGEAAEQPNSQEEKMITSERAVSELNRGDGSSITDTQTEIISNQSKEREVYEGSKIADSDKDSEKHIKESQAAIDISSESTVEETNSCSQVDQIGAEKEEELKTISARECTKKQVIAHENTIQDQSIMLSIVKEAIAETGNKDEMTESTPEQEANKGSETVGESIEENIVLDLPIIVGDEMVKSTSNEYETDVVKSKEEEHEPDGMKNDLESIEKTHALTIPGTSKEANESNKCMEDSPSEHEENEKETEEHILLRAASDKEISFKKADAKDKVQVEESDLTFDEEDLLTARTSEARPENAGIVYKPAETSGKGEHEDQENPISREQGADEDAINEDSTEVATAEKPVDDILEEDNEEPSSIDNKLMKIEANETTDLNFLANQETPLHAEATEEKLAEKEESINPNNDAEIGTVHLEIENTDKESQGEDQDVDLNKEQCSFESEVELHSNTDESQILKDKELPDLGVLEDKNDDRRPSDDTSEVPDACAGTEKPIQIHEDLTNNFEGSSRKDDYIEKLADELKAAGWIHESEASESQQTSTLNKEKLESIDSSAELRSESKSLHGDRRNEEESNNLEDQNTKSNEDLSFEQGIPESKIKIGEEMEPKIESNDQLDETQEAIEKAVILTEEVLPEVDTENIDEQILEKESCSEEHHPVFEAKEMVNEVQDQHLESILEPEATDPNTEIETVRSKVAEDINWGTEASAIRKAIEEETVKDNEEAMADITESEKQEENNTENMEEAETCVHKSDTAPIAVTEETRSGAVQQNETDTMPHDTNSYVKSPQTIKTADASLHAEEVDSVKPEETSGMMSQDSQLPTIEHERSDDKSTSTKESDSYDFQETKTSDIISESKPKCIEELCEPGASLTGETETTAIGENIKDIPDTKPLSIFQGVEAVSVAEVTSDQSLATDKLEEQLHVPSSALPSRKLDLESITLDEKIEDGDKKYKETEPASMKLEEPSGIVSQLLKEECQNVESAKVEETNISKAVIESDVQDSEKIWETKASPTLAKTDTDELEEIVQVFPEIILEPAHQGIQATTDDRNPHQILQAEELELQLQVPSTDREMTTIFNELEDENTKKDEAEADSKKLQQASCTASELSTIEPSDDVSLPIEKAAIEVEEEEAKASVSGDMNSEETHEIKTGLTTEMNEGTEAVADGEITPDQILTVEISEEHLKVPPSLCSKEEDLGSNTVIEKLIEEISVKDASEADSKKHQETSGMDSQLLTIEPEIVTDDMNVTVEEVTDVEAKETKNSDTEFLSIDRELEEIHENETSLTMEKTNACKVENEINNVPETLPEAECQGVEAVTDREITPNQTLGAGKSEEKLQVAPPDLCSNEEDYGTTTTIEKFEDQNLKKDEAEVESMKHQETSGIDSQLSTIEPENADDMNVTVEEVADVEAKDTKNSNTEFVSMDRDVDEIHETKTSLTKEKTAACKQENEIEDIPETKPGAESQGVEAITDREITPDQALAAGKSEEKLQVSPPELYSKEEDHGTTSTIEKFKDENLKTDEAEVDSMKHQGTSGMDSQLSTIQPENADDMNVTVEDVADVEAKENKNSDTEFLSIDRDFEEIHESETSLTMEITDECKVENEIDNVTEKCQGVEAVTDREIIPDQTIAVGKSEEKLQVPPPDLCPGEEDHGTTTTIEKFEDENLKKDEPEVDSMKHQETSGIISQLSTIVLDNADELDVVLEKEANKVEVEETKDSKAAYITETIPVPQYQSVEAVADGDIIPGQTLTAEKSEEQLQFPSTALLSKEEDHKMTTTSEKIEDESTKKETEVDIMKLEENSCIISQTTIELENAEDGSVIVEKAADSFEVKETKTSNAVCVSEDRDAEQIHETRVSVISEKTDAFTLEKEIEDTPETIPDSEYQGVEAVGDGENTSNQTTEKSEEQLQVPFTALLSKEEDLTPTTTVEKIEDENATKEETDVHIMKKLAEKSEFSTIESEFAEDMDVIVERGANEVEIEDAEALNAAFVSQERGAGEIHETSRSLIVEKSDACKMEEGIKDVPETIPECEYQGVEAVTVDEISPNQNLIAVNSEDQFQVLPTTLLSIKEDHGTTTTVEMLEDNAKVAGMENRETPGIISHISAIQPEIADEVTATVQKEAYDFEVEETKNFNAVFVSSNTDIEEIHETKTSLKVEKSEASKLEGINEAFEALSKLKYDGEETPGDGEINQDLILAEGKSEGHLHVPLSPLLPEEEDHRTTITTEKIEDESTRKEDIQVDSMKLNKSSCIVSQSTTAELDRAKDTRVTLEEGAVEVEENKAINEGFLSKDNDAEANPEIRTSITVEETDASELEDDIKEVAQTIPALEYEGVKSLTDGEIIPEAVESEEQLNVLSTALLSKKQDDESATTTENLQDQSTKENETNSDNLKLQETSGALSQLSTIEPENKEDMMVCVAKEAVEVETKDSKTTDTAYDSKDQGAYKILETDAGSKMEQTGMNIIEKEIQEIPNLISKAQYHQGVETVINFEITPDQTLPAVELEDKLQVPSSLLLTKDQDSATTPTVIKRKDENVKEKETEYGSLKLEETSDVVSHCPQIQSKQADILIAENLNEDEVEADKTSEEVHESKDQVVEGMHEIQSIQIVGRTDTDNTNEAKEVLKPTSAPEYQDFEEVSDGVLTSDQALPAKTSEDQFVEPFSPLILKEQYKDATTIIEKTKDESAKEDDNQVNEDFSDQLAASTIEERCVDKEEHREPKVSNLNLKLHENTQDIPTEAPQEEGSARNEVSALENQGHSYETIYVDSTSECEMRTNLSSCGGPSKDKDILESGSSNENADDLPNTQSTVKEALTGEVGEKCSEASTLKFEPKDETVFEEEQLETATERSNEASQSKELYETKENKISREKTKEEKNTCQDTIVVSPDDETIAKSDQEDEVRQKEHPGENINETTDVTKNETSSEKEPEELEKSGTNKDDKEVIAAEDRAVDDIYQTSAANLKADECLSAEAEEGKDVDKAIVEDLVTKGGETKSTERVEEAPDIHEKVSSTRTVMVKQEEDTIGVNDKETAIIKDEEVNRENIADPPVTDATAEEATDKEVGKEIDEVSIHKQTIDEASISAGEKSIRCEQLQKDEESIEHSTGEKERTLDKPEIHSLTAVKEEKESRVQHKELDILTDSADSGSAISQKYINLDFAKVNDINNNIQEAEKITLEKSNEQIPRERTEVTHPTFSNETSLVQAVTAGITFQQVEELRAGNGSAAEPEEYQADHGEKKIEAGECEEIIEKSTPAESAKGSLSDLQQGLPEETSHEAEHLTEKGELVTDKEERLTEKAEETPVKETTDEGQDEEEEEDENKRADSGSDALVMVEASRDMDVKTPHKKSHNILSGVGSKVKHSIAKVKKAIIGKSSHPKEPIPK